MPWYRAAWVVPISGPPVRGGVVAVEGDRITSIHAEPARASELVDLGRIAIMPGLVNAHTHLELSWLRGCVPPRAQFGEWVREVMRLRRSVDPAAVERAIAEAVHEARACGTSLVGDISNTLVAVPALLTSRIRGVVFREAIGFQSSKAEGIVSGALAELEAVAWTTDLRGMLAAHAPYSVSPALFTAIARHAAAHGHVTTVHVAESPQEVEFVRTGLGDPRTMLEELRVWDPAWEVPACSPVEYLDRLGYLGSRTLAVHAVQTTADDLALLRARGATVVTCPRSNEWTGVGSPPIAAFFGSGVRVAMGTDSLASAPDLNLFAELAAARRLAPEVPARDLLRAATLNGAEALGFGDFGSIAPGKRADLIAVSLPPRVDDVEEYLVGGVTPDQIVWIHS